MYQLSQPTNLHFLLLIKNPYLPPPPPIRYSPSVTIKRSPPPVVTPKPPSPVLIEKSPPVVVVQPRQTPQPTAPPSVLVPSNNFEKAPPMKINYIPKSPDTHSIHNYTSGPLTVVQRSSSVNVKPGNRWYDYDYDKRVKPLVVDDL